MTKPEYLCDPDGKGIEIYAETPEVGKLTIDRDSASAIDRNGVPRSGRDPIDLDALFCT